MRSFVLYLLLLGGPLTVFSQRLRTGPVPGWAKPQALPVQENTAAKGMGGSFYLDYEKQISLADETIYNRRAVRITSAEGVEDQSEVEVDFDPSYQQLVFHTVQVFRDGKAINKLQPGKFRLLQKEEEADKHLYNGSLSALLILDDIRQGDVLEYSYSLKGFNPVFKGKWAGFFDLQFSLPLGRLFYRLVVPQGRSVQLRNRHTAMEPVKNTEGTSTTYEWLLSDVPSFAVDENTPEWYDPYPVVQLSEYRSWNEVAAWAASLFPAGGEADAGLKARIDSIRKQAPDPAGQMGAALRFVQDEIRYTGIEMGENGHRPHTPAQTLQQRFGDCKDKSYLLCTLLNGLGLAASPVLVNTGRRKTIEDWLPAANVFDHCIVKASYGGRDYFFDPTITGQRGPATAISLPAYEAGLVVQAGGAGLTAIPATDPGKVIVKEYFKVLSMAGRAQLEVRTTYTGSFADAIRADFGNTPADQIAKEYRKFYNNYFTRIAVDTIHGSDDGQGNFVVTENYRIEKIWGDKTDRKEAVFEPFLINSYLKKVKDAERKMPYALHFPVHYDEEVRIDLPEDWSGESFSKQIQNEAFRFSMDYDVTGSRVTLHYVFDHNRDHVAAEGVDAFNRDMDEAISHSAYSLSQKMTGSSGSDTTKLNLPMSNFSMLYLLLGLCVFITYQVRKSRRA